MKCPAMSASRRIINLTTTLCLAFGSMWCRGVPAIAEPPVDSPLVFHTWENFTTKDGLPHNSIRAIRIVDHDVWVGTEGGLALYDGGSWKSWAPDDHLGARAVTAIDVDPSTGELWLGTWGGGLMRFSAGRFDQFDQINSGLPGNLVFAVRVAGGRIWAATNAGLSAFDPVNDTWDLYASRRTDTPETVITHLSADGDYLYTAGWGLDVRKFDLTQREWTTLHQPTSAEQGDLAEGSLFGGAAIGFTAVGRTLWLLTQDQLLEQSETKTWLAHGFGAHLGGDNFVRCLASRDETEAWVGTSGGLCRLVDRPTGTWLTYGRCKGGDAGLVTLTRRGQVIATQMLTSTIPDNQIRCIAFGRDAIWVGTVNGLACARSRMRWSNLPSSSDTAKAICRLPATSLPAAHDVPEGSSAPKTVTIGVLGPIVRSIALPGGDPSKNSDAGRADLLGAQLAVDQANARGGYRGRIPFRLAMGVGGYERYGWGTPDDDFATFRYREEALGIVAHLGSGNFIRSAVASQTEVPVINVAASPPGTNEQVNPWVFRCPNDDPRQHEKLVNYVVEHMGCTRLGLIRTPDVLASRHLDLWGRFAREGRGGKPVLVAEVAYDPDSAGLDDALRNLAGSGVQAVLTWCDAAVSARVLRRMRELGMSQLFVGSHGIVSDEFAVLVGPDPGLVVAPNPCPHRKDLKALSRFAKRYAEQNSPAGLRRPPTLGAYLTYHATGHILQAINAGGVDRHAIRRALVRMADTGLAILRRGRWEPLVLPPG